MSFIEVLMQESNEVGHVLIAVKDDEQVLVGTFICLGQGDIGTATGFQVQVFSDYVLY